MTKEKDLITRTEWAERAGIQRTLVYQLTRPQQIETDDIGGIKFIDCNKYPPETWNK